MRAAPTVTLRDSATPVLLIHGTRDTNIPPAQSRELHAVNPGTTELWEVPGAIHVAAMSAEPQAYRRARAGVVRGTRIYLRTLAPMCNLRFPRRRPMSAPKMTVAMIAAPCAPSACDGAEIGQAIRQPALIARPAPAP
jgi:hypothetical protein